MGALTNARWVALAQIFKIGGQIIGLFVLARLLPPSEYGIMAMATVATNFAAIFRDLGTSAALIQKKELLHPEINATFWFNIALGCGIALLIACASPLIAHAFHEQKLIPVMLWLCLAFPVASAGAVHQALMERESQFKDVARIEITSVCAGLATAVVLALMGAGVYSLVAQTLITAATSSLQFWQRSKWRPTSSRAIGRGDFAPILGFGSNLAGFNTINYFSRNADAMVIGHFMAAAILGAYSLAYRIMLFPLQSMTFVASRSLYPILSKKQDDIPSVLSTYLRLIRLVALIVSPMMAGMVVVRNDFVALFLGPQWSLTADLLLWLAPTGLIQSVVSTTGLIFMTTGNVKMLLRISIFNAATQVSAFLIGAKLGITELAALYLFANIINFWPNMHFTMNLLNGKLVSVIKAMAPPISLAIMMAVIVVLLGKMDAIANLSIAWRLCSQVLMGGAIYAALTWIIIPSYFELASGLLRRTAK